MSKGRMMIPVLLALLLSLAGCSPVDDGLDWEPVGSTGQEQDTAMQFITPQAMLEIIQGGGGDYICLDVRSADDYAAGHIAGALSAPVTHGENSDDAASGANLTAALNQGQRDEGTVIYILCYKGGAFAQKAHQLLLDMGLPGGCLYTLEGGYQTWKASGEDYTAMLE